jgi:hypothetical protein
VEEEEEEEEEEVEDEDAPPLLPAKLILPPAPLLFLAIAIVEKLPKLGAATSAKASAAADIINRVVLKFTATMVSAIYYTSLQTLFYPLVNLIVPIPN